MTSRYVQRFRSGSIGSAKLANRIAQQRVMTLVLVAAYCVLVYAVQSRIRMTLAPVASFLLLFPVAVFGFYLFSHVFHLIQGPHLCS
jgi:hypothetical protein